MSTIDDSHRVSIEFFIGRPDGTPHTGMYSPTDLVLRVSRPRCAIPEQSPFQAGHIVAAIIHETVMEDQNAEMPSVQVHDAPYSDVLIEHVDVESANRLMAELTKLDLCNLTAVLLSQIEEKP